MTAASAIKSIWLTSALVISANAWADWTGRGEAGVAFANSNASTTTSTMNAKFELVNQLEQWKHAFGASGVYASNKDENDLEETTANRWEAHQQSDFEFSQRGFWFESLRHESDEIGSFEYVSSVTTGLGHKFADSETVKLSVQFGVGYKMFRPRVQTPDVAQSDDDVIGSGVVDYQQKLTGNTTLTDKLTVESGASNTSAQNDLALQVKMTDVLALSLGYQLRYNSDPGMRTATAAFEKYDRLTTANLVYEFK
jgi:putative salt-induced outer membrane protein